MVNYKNGKWAKKIIGIQKNDGSWGINFHGGVTGGATKENPLSTEQALARLRHLGFKITDEPIRRTVDLMTACLRGERKIDNYYEKKHDWEFFTKFMLSAWIRVFDKENETALSFAQQLAQVAEKAFEDEYHNVDNHKKAFTEVFGRKPNKQSAWEYRFGMLYDAVLLQGLLQPETESKLLNHYLAIPDGIYYLNSGQLNMPPEVFASRKTSRYIAGLEVLAGYKLAKEKLTFAVDWLNSNKNADNMWDLGQNAKDGIYFPLSDSWRCVETREADCTYRIQKLLNSLD